MIKRIQGFTLLEVLVTLALLATVLTASFTLEAQSIHHLHHLKQKILAHWAGNNVIAHIQLGMYSKEQLNSLEGSTTMGEEQFFWRVEETPIANKQYKEYTLYLKHENPIETMRFYSAQN